MKKPKGKSRNKDGEKTSNYQRTALKSSKAKVKESKRNTGTDNNINLDDASFKASSQDSEKWYSSVPADPDKFDPCPNNTINELMDEARKVLDSETNGYNIKASKNSEQSWMRSVMSKGTGKDKMAAFTLMIQEKALYNLHALQSLVSLVKPGKKESVACIDTLVELFITELLPPETKLKKFSQRPLSMLEDLSSGNPAGRRRRLVAWYFEDQLKTVYQNFIDSLRVIASEAVEASKEKAVKAMAALLEAHPEQETILLSNIVNKMGDPSKKVASKSMHCLTQVLGKHPNMKGVIINEVEKLLFRPNVGQKARYYSICFLSQILFRKNDSQIAANLIKLYFSFFKACVKLGDVDSRMLSVLLSGVNRAYPYAREAMDTISEQLDTLYKVIHMAPFHVSLQGLSLLFQVADYKNNVSDRFYSVLYRKLLDPELCHTSHVPIFLNLTFQALKKDESVPRVRAFIKRLLQVCCGMPVSMICGTLYMISQIIHNRSGLVATSFGPPIKTEFDSVKVEKQDSLPSGFTDDESEDEHYEDVPLDEDILSRKVEESRMSDNSDLRSKIEQPAWIHKIKGRKETKHDNFDPMQRNPLYANGALCTYSELCLLSQHFHPTVALFASQILNSEQITYSGDPLKDFTLLRFLERFSFKNPKKQPETQSNSLFAKRQNYRATGVKGMPVTSKMYLSQEQGKVPVDEKYLFCFLQKRRNIATEQKLKDKEDESDVESVNSDEFEELLDDIMKKKGFKKDIDEDDDFDADIDFANEYKKNMSFKKSLKKKDGKDKDSDSSQDEAENSDNEFDDDVDAYSEVSDKDYMNDDLQEEAPSEDLVDPQDDHGDLSEEDFDFENLDDGAEDMDFDDSDDTVDENMSQTPKKFKKKKKAGLDSDVFASAEEFSELIEAAGAAREGSSGAVSNKDKASMKQLNWEADRDRWVKGYKSYTSGGKGAGGKTKGKPRGVKRPSFKTKRKKRF